jgi:hypothetical protein
MTNAERIINPQQLMARFGAASLEEARESWIRALGVKQD